MVMNTPIWFCLNIVVKLAVDTMEVLIVLAMKDISCCCSQSRVRSIGKIRKDDFVRLVFLKL